MITSKTLKLSSLIKQKAPTYRCLELEALKKVRGLEDRKIGYLRHTLAAENNSFPGGKVRMGADGDIGSRQVELLNDTSLSSHPLTLHSSQTKRAAFTLAEVFSPHFADCRKAAFTLAEVLITLGIIGVVAAMTLPTLIHNYQKKVIGTRLAQTYSILSQAVQLSQAQYGDTKEWNNYEGQGGQEVNKEEVITAFAEKYIVPHLKVIKNHGFTSLKEAGLSSYTNKDGSIYQDDSKNFYIADLCNGTTLLLNLNANRNSQGELISYTELFFFIDINGRQKPNTIGRDLYGFYIENNKVVAYGDKNDKYTSFQIKQSGKPYREALLDICAGAGIYCAGLIKSDGWELKEDYPW